MHLQQCRPLSHILAASTPLCGGTTPFLLQTMFHKFEVKCGAVEVSCARRMETLAPLMGLGNGLGTTQAMFQVRNKSQLLLDQLLLLQVLHATAESASEFVRWSRELQEKGSLMLKISVPSEHATAP